MEGTTTSSSSTTTQVVTTTIQISTSTRTTSTTTNPHALTSTTTATSTQIFDPMDPELAGLTPLQLAYINQRAAIQAGPSTSSSTRLSTPIRVTTIKPKIERPFYNPKSMTLTAFLSKCEKYFNSQDFTEPQFHTAVHTVLTNIFCANSTTMNVIGNADIEMQSGHRSIQHRGYVVTDTPVHFILGLDVISRYGIVPNGELGYSYFIDDSGKHYDTRGVDRLISFSVMDRLQGDFEKGSLEQRIEELFNEIPHVLRRDGTLGRQTDTLLQQGLIERSTSSYGLYVVLEKESDGTWKLAVNYKKSNRETCIVAIPSDNDKHIVPSGGFFASLDLRSAYCQIPLSKDSTANTAFYV